tara:strand:- start:1431 stop:2183 length:753 start_codon:yes stop_codon:yes gene_type:complete
MLLTLNINIPYCLIIFAIICILFISLLIGTIISYYCYKYIKKYININYYYLKDYNKYCKDILKEYGDYKIKYIYIGKKPITYMVELGVNLVSLYQYQTVINNYKKKNNCNLYPHHSFFIVELELPNKKSKLILVDKINCLRISLDFKIESDQFILHKLSLKKKKLTLNAILEDTKQRLGDEAFFNWSLYKNNCIEFTREFLITINNYNKETQQFIDLDISNIKMNKLTNYLIYIVFISLNYFNKITNYFI